MDRTGIDGAGMMSMELGGWEGGRRTLHVMNG